MPFRNSRRQRHVSAEIFLSVLLVLTVLITTAIGVVTRILGEELCIRTSGEVKSVYTIIIDAGHGGEDCGAIGVNGIYEKDLNLAISLEIGEELKRQGYRVIYTRTEDKLLYKDSENIKGIRKISDLKNRAAIADEHDSPIFVSVHMNSFGDSKYSGLQVYYGTYSSESMVLAQSIQDCVRANLQPDNDRKIKEGKNIYLLENITVPTVLIECGFLSNLEECKKLSEKEYQKQLSFLIVCGIIEYIDGHLD